MTAPSDDLRDLYQSLLLDHSRRPHRFREMSDSDAEAEGANPLCGDHVRVFIRLDNDRLTDVSFTGQGCAICMASASMMTDAVVGQSTQRTLALFDTFHNLLTGGSTEPANTDIPKELLALEGVRKFPIRVKCATLPWHTLRNALRRDETMVSTE